jgi:hypothetical protein
MNIPDMLNNNPINCGGQYVSGLKYSMESQAPTPSTMDSIAP